MADDYLSNQIPAHANAYTMWLPEFTIRLKTLVEFRINTLVAIQFMVSSIAMVMEKHNTPLLLYLSQKNPILNTSNHRSGQNTRSTRRPWKEPLRIEVWEDFHYESLKSTCGGHLMNLLDLRIKQPEGLEIPPIPFCEISDEDALNSLLGLWTHRIVSKALEVSQRAPISITTPGTVYMYRGGQAEFLSEYPKDSKKPHHSYPDWAAVRLESAVLGNEILDAAVHGAAFGTDKLQNKRTPLKPINILPGDTKVSWKWKSKHVPMGNQEIFKQKQNYIQPILQVFNYCLKANARYGYIITDEELVVLRVKVDEAVPERADSQKSQIQPDSQEQYASMEQKKARHDGVVELMSIPWDNHVDDVESAECGLTVNLALWWLHIMASIQNQIGSGYLDLAEEKLPKPPPTGDGRSGCSKDSTDLDLMCSISFNSQDGNISRGKRKRQSNCPDFQLKSPKRGRGANKGPVAR